MNIDLEAWDKLPAQGECYDDNITTTLLYSGGLGSGKTHYLVRKALKLSVLNRDMPGGFLVPTFPDFRKDVKPEFEKILSDLGLEYKKHWDFHETFKEYTFCWSKAPLYIFTGEKPIAGPNLAYCLINEYSLMKWVRVNEMLRRVRLKEANYMQKCLAGTPEDVHGWLEEFVEGQEKLNQKRENSFRIITADTSQNHHIDDDYRMSLEATLDEAAMRIFAAGEIGIRAGTDYFYYSYDKLKNSTEEAEYRPGVLTYVGLDFNVGKMAATYSHFLRGHLPDGTGDELHTFDEVFLEGDSNTYTMCRELICRWCAPFSAREELLKAKNHAEIFDDIWFKLSSAKRQSLLRAILIICDASGNNRSASAKEHLMSNVKILKHYGLNVKHKKANPRIRKRQLLVNGLLANQRHKIHPRCKRTHKDLKNTRQKVGSYEKDEGKDHEYSHFSDGIDYVVDWNFKLPEKRSRISVIPR